MLSDINNEYFEWLVTLVCDRRFGKGVSYRKLLHRLYITDFRFSIPRDVNRAEDGRELRRRFILCNGYEDWYETVMEHISGPCTVLEMIIALAIRCEESIMDDTQFGNRTGQWFWSMINNLGLGGMTDDSADIDEVDFVVDRFMNRDYEPNGKGGLFTIRRCEIDLRTVEIWVQMLWYLDTIT